MAEDQTPQEVTEAEPMASKKTGKPTMSVKVYAPFRVYFEGEAYSVSAENATGPFDILPKHYNFLCMLVPCQLTVETLDGSTKTVRINRALMHVKAESVVVFMGV